MDKYAKHVIFWLELPQINIVSFGTVSVSVGILHNAPGGARRTGTGVRM